MLIIAVWAAVVILGWAFIFGAAVATESSSVDRAEHDAEIERASLTNLDQLLTVRRRRDSMTFQVQSSIPPPPFVGDHARQTTPRHGT